MRVTRTKLDRAVFLGLAGRLTVNAETEGLRATLCEISDSDVFCVFVDLENVTRLDCWGIAELVRLRSHVVGTGRMFGLVNPDRYHRSLLALLRIPAICRIYGSRQDALRSVAPLSSKRIATSPEPSLTVDPRLAIARLAAARSGHRSCSTPPRRALPRQA